MKRLILGLLLFTGVAQAQTPVQTLQPISLGWFAPNIAPGNSGYTVNAANDRLCWSFMLSDDKTLSKVKTDIYSVTGTPSGAETQLLLTADASGFPSGSVAETKALAGSPTTGMNEWTGFTTALTAGTRYWLCHKNTNATPASNYITIRVPDVASSTGGVGHAGTLGNQTKWSWQFCDSADSGASCANVNRWAMPIGRLEFSDGTFVGSGLLSSSYGWDSTNKIYSTREQGVTATVPADAPSLNVKCLSIALNLNGTAPAGGLRLRLYTGATGARTLRATTTTIPAANVALGWHHACFTSSYTLAPGTQFSVVAGAVSGGDTSNYYSVQTATIDNTAGSKALGFFGGISSAYYDGSSWTDTDTKATPFLVHLDTNDPFGVTAGVPQRNKFNQGLN